MRKPLFLTIALVCSLAVAADEKPVKGTFITNVDDHATIYVNGIKVFHADIGTSRSEETELKIGDRVVAHLTNDIGPKHFILVFAASDGRTTISFRANDFRIVPQVGVKDFQPEQFARWTKPARRFSGTKGLDRIVKNHSDWVWGDLDRCIVACTISGVMCSHAQ